MTTLHTATTDTVYTKEALKALSGLPCGPLSPLARVAATDRPADAAALAATLMGLSGAWEQAAPALFNPQRTLLFLAGDGETSLVGQYVWPDRAARGPGFQVVTSDTAVRLNGPHSAAHIAGILTESLGLGQVVAPEPVRLSLTLPQFWCLAAMADAYAYGLLRRRLERLHGRPLGVAQGDVLALWAAGVEGLNLGWAVSLFATLLPDYLPQDFPATLDATLAAMEQGDLLLRVDDTTGDPRAGLLLFGEDLNLLCQGLVQNASLFGLVLQDQTGPKTTATAMLGGWRTPQGLWVADFGRIDDDAVELQLLGPEYLLDVINEVYVPNSGEDSFETALAADQRYAVAGLLKALQAAPPPPSAPPRPAPATPAAPVTPPAPAAPDQRFCAQCGKPLNQGAKFCRACGSQIS